MERIISEILDEMSDALSIEQQKKLQQVLIKKLADNKSQTVPVTNDDYEKLFLDAKKIEGCSERTLLYYKATLDRFLDNVHDQVSG